MTNFENSGQSLLRNIRNKLSSINMETYLLFAFIIIIVVLWSINYTHIYSHEVKINQAYAILKNLSDNLKDQLIKESEEKLSTVQVSDKERYVLSHKIDALRNIN